MTLRYRDGTERAHDRLFRIEGEACLGKERVPDDDGFHDRDQGDPGDVIPSKSIDERGFSISTEGLAVDLHNGRVVGRRVVSDVRNRFHHALHGGLYPSAPT